MTTSSAALSAGPTTSFGVPPQDRSSRRALARRLHTPAWWRLACGIAAWASVVLVVALWVHGGGVQELAGMGTGLTSIGRLAGLVGSDLLLLQVLLMARVPWVERAFGQDDLARRHSLATYSVGFMMAYVVAISLGHSAAASTGLWSTIADVVASYPGMLPGVAGTVALVAVAVTPNEAVRRRLRYESWPLRHVYAGLGLLLVLPHQLGTGQGFLTSTLATVLWWALWVAAAASVLIWRVGQPWWRSRRHRLVVAEVRPENDRVTTVVIRGQMLDQLPVRAGQFFQWRFLEGPGFSQAHPHSLSAAPDGRTLRITVAHPGGGSAQLAGLRPGTRVFFEGPYGRLHEGVRTRRKVLLMASGIGITPMRALLEDLDQGPGEVTLVYRVGSERERILMDELNTLADLHQTRFFVVTGHRVSSRRSWLPEHVAYVDDSEALRLIVPDVAEHDVFVSGSPGWVEAVKRAAIGAGVPRGQVHIERFAS
ncbi:MAG TPA: ferric reductase-like transmembrane domain-containing protein [Dermatophilaceae bacterium]|nr:ferric reductase-like transmembrane domain-containing protein [Dermatophilaceae bacterium]